MCHPNGGILSGGSSLLFPPAVSRRRWPSARAAARGLGERDVSASRAAALSASRTRRCSAAASSSFAASSAAVEASFSRFSRPRSGRRASAAASAAASVRRLPRARLHPRIHASGTTLSLYSACSARNGPCLAHMASRRCPDSRRWRIRAWTSRTRGYQPRANRWQSPRARRQRGDDVAVAALAQVDVLERAGTPRASLQGRNEVVGAAAGRVAAVR